MVQKVFDPDNYTGNEKFIISIDGPATVKYDPENKCNPNNGIIAVGGSGYDFTPYSKWDGQTTYNTYSYSTSYTYDDETKKFTLSGDVVTREVHENELDEIVGLYTCRENGTTTCSTIFKIGNKLNNNKLELVTIYYTTYESSSIGSGVFNENPVTSSLSGAGYKYGDYREFYDTDIWASHSISSKGRELFTKSGKISNSYYIAEGAEQLSDNPDNGYTRFRAINPVPVSEITDYRDLIGKYIFYSSPILENNKSTASWLPETILRSFIPVLV